MKPFSALVCTLLFTTAGFAAEPVPFNARTAKSGPWSDAKTWQDGRA